MESVREFDFIIFGASGFTGQFVVDEVQRIAADEDIRWAVAGRNKEKLSNVVKETGNSKGVCSEMIVADVNDFQSILMMCKQANVILDCVGPYRFFGEAVVKGCIEAKTNYVDISGEPQFLEDMVLKYNDGAELGGIYIVGACGFDSIPSDLGVMYAKQEFPGTLNSLQGYLGSLPEKIESSRVHFGTYASAVHGIGNAKQLKKIRQAFGHQPLPLVGPKLKSKGAVHHFTPLGKYAIPFVGPDVSVVNRSQRYLHECLNEPPIQYSMYSCINGLFNVLMLCLFGTTFLLLASNSWGRSLLLRHPKFFSGGVCSHEGPSKKQIDESSFSITMYGEGYSDGKDTLNRTDKPDKKITVRVSGPEGGYVTTSIAMVQAALVIVKEKNDLPESGGVYSPGAAFYKTSLIRRLQRNGLKFEVLD